MLMHLGLSLVEWKEEVVRGHHWERKEMVKAKFCAEVSKEQGVLSNMLEPEDQGRPVGTGWDAMAYAGPWGVLMARTEHTFLLYALKFVQIFTQARKLHALGAMEGTESIWAVRNTI